MRVTVTLVDPDETFDVDNDARDRRAFERVGARALGQTGRQVDVMASLPETYLTWVTWHAATRRGNRADLGSFDEFEQRVIQIQPHPEAPDAEADGLGDPTRPAASAG
jgi:hypothetical protein